MFEVEILEIICSAPLRCFLRCALPLDQLVLPLQLKLEHTAHVQRVPLLPEVLAHSGRLSDRPFKNAKRSRKPVVSCALQFVAGTPTICNR